MTKRQLRALARHGETWVQTLARVHHEAYMVEAFGYAASGLAPGEFLKLVKYGVVAAPDDEHVPNAFEVVFQSSAEFAQQGNALRADMRSWSADRWRKYLKKQAVKKIAPVDTAHTITDKIGARETVVLPGGSITSEHMHAAEDFAHQVQAAFSPPPPGSVAPVRHVPKAFGRAQQYAYTQAVERAGLFCKRLGEVTGGDFSLPTTERWHFDKILEEVDPVLRAGRLRKIRTTVLQALQDDWKPYRLAHELQQATGDYARDWMRVAVTELQNAWNEGVGLEAVRQYGINARVARIPETTACADCLRLCLHDGIPIIFDMHVLLRHGNNMNVPKGSWKATLSAIHPRCRCGVVLAPPNSTVDRQGNVHFETP